MEEVLPIAAEIDGTERFSEEIWHKLSEMGMIGLPIPEECGGAELSCLTYIGVCEELENLAEMPTEKLQNEQVELAI